MPPLHRCVTLDETPNELNSKLKIYSFRVSEEVKRKSQFLVECKQIEESLGAGLESAVREINFTMDSIARAIEECKLRMLTDLFFQARKNLIPNLEVFRKECFFKIKDLQVVEKRNQRCLEWGTFAILSAQALDWKLDNSKWLNFEPANFPFEFASSVNQLKDLYMQEITISNEFGEEIQELLQQVRGGHVKKQKKTRSKLKLLKSSLAKEQSDARSERIATQSWEKERDTLRSEKQEIEKQVKTLNKQKSELEQQLEKIKIKCKRSIKVKICHSETISINIELWNTYSDLKKLVEQEKGYDFKAKRISLYKSYHLCKDSDLICEPPDDLEIS